MHGKGGLVAEISATVKVLISSKQREFELERRDIGKMIKPLPLLVADAAEGWSPQSASIHEIFLHEAKTCGIYVGLFGCVYSHPTIQEYEAAAENRYRPLLLYVKECANREAELAAFIERICDPESGHTIVVYSDWDSVRERFAEHLWTAIGRLVEYALQLGSPPVALGAQGALERRWAERRRGLVELGLPENESEALAFCESLKNLGFPAVARDTKGS